MDLAGFLGEAIQATVILLGETLTDMGTISEAIPMAVEIILGETRMDTGITSEETIQDTVILSEVTLMDLAQLSTQILHSIQIPHSILIPPTLRLTRHLLVATLPTRLHIPILHRVLRTAATQVTAPHALQIVALRPQPTILLTQLRPLPTHSPHRATRRR